MKNPRSEERGFLWSQNKITTADVAVSRFGSFFRFTRGFSRNLSIISAKIAYVFKSAGVRHLCDRKTAFTQ